MRKLIVTVSVLAFVVQGCASVTTIKSTPPGAKVYVEKQFIGTTPVKYEDSDVFWAKKDIEVQMDGYEPLKAKLIKTEANVGAIIGAVLVTVPILWVTEYPAEFNYELRPLVSQSSAIPAAIPASNTISAPETPKNQ